MKHTFPEHRLWRTYQHAGYDAAKTMPLHSAFDAFYMAALAFGEEDFPFAAECARLATETAPQRLVFQHAATYLERVVEHGRSNVYIDGEAFAAFIRGGSNRCLYENTSTALRAVYQESGSLNLLDIGAGDGLALLPALSESVRSVTVLEPSETMLKKLCVALDRRGAPAYRAIHSTLQDFIGSCSEEWDVIESTFCLHAIMPAERKTALAWMRAHGRRLLLTEFNVPDFPEMYAPERVRFFIERYEQGLAEYADDGELVAQDFLMPVMLGNFDRSRARSTYEQPIARWRSDLQSAGFQTVTARELYPYWWVAAYLIDAC